MDQAMSLISYADILLYIACGVVIVRRFRGSPGAVLGGIAFGVWAADGIAREVLSALHVSWGHYGQVLTFLNLAAAGCLLAAIITGRAHGQARGVVGAKGVTNTGGRSPMSVSEVLFSFKGRISRSESWLKGYLILLPFGILNTILMYGVRSEGARAVATIIGIAASWPGLAIIVKRLHDRNRSGWFAATMLIPVVNIVFICWIWVEVWFLRGTIGPNRFGDDPVQESAQIARQ